MKTVTKLWIGIGALAIASPIGLFLPNTFKAGTAWGEWGIDEIKSLTGYVPHGMEKLSSLWKALLPDYTFKVMEQQRPGHLSISYVMCAVIGVLLCVGVSFLIGKILSKRES